MHVCSVITQNGFYHSNDKFFILVDPMLFFVTAALPIQLQVYFTASSNHLDRDM